MPDIHVPQLEDHDAPSGGRSRGTSIAKLLLEMLLISAGVFLGIAGEQWRENVGRRELARAALERFRVEMVTNQKGIKDVVDYHVKLRDEIAAYFNAKTPEERKTTPIHLSGLQPVFFERTAWDVATATQSLAYIDPDLVFSLSEAYVKQDAYVSLTNNLMQTTYAKPLALDREGFFAAIGAYLGDASYLEPTLLKMYDDLLPKIDQELAK